MFNECGRKSATYFVSGDNISGRNGKISICKKSLSLLAILLEDEAKDWTESLSLLFQET